LAATRRDASARFSARSFVAASRRSFAAIIAVSATFTLSPVATISPGLSVGSLATSILASPKVSLPLQVQSEMSFWRYTNALSRSA
jgi:hypothetical protein